MLGSEGICRAQLRQGRTGAPLTRGVRAATRAKKRRDTFKVVLHLDFQD
jgi:hypothetical protein